MWSINSKLGLGGIYDPEIVETQLGYIRMFGPLCGHPWLQTARAASGATSLFIPVMDRMMRIIAGSRFLNDFYWDYRPNPITKVVQDALKQGRIKPIVVSQALQELCASNNNLNLDDAFYGDDLKWKWTQYLLTQAGIFKRVKK